MVPVYVTSVTQPACKSPTSTVIGMLTDDPVSGNQNTWLRQLGLGPGIGHGPEMADAVELKKFVSWASTFHRFVHRRFNSVSHCGRWGTMNWPPSLAPVPCPPSADMAAMVVGSGLGELLAVKVMDVMTPLLTVATVADQPGNSASVKESLTL